MIDVQRLVFEYPGTRALDDVSFAVHAGSVTALVGPNGAGKTTLLRCLAALEEPLAGTLRVDGVDVGADPRECHRRVGYLSDFFGLYDALSVRQCLAHAASANGVSAALLDGVITRSAGRLGIGDRLETKAGALSRGLRQRLAIAQAIVHEPKLLLLDEPAAGLDPEARHSLAQLFLDLQAGGMTLFVSSHILAELEEYSTDMLVLRKGRLVAHEALRRVGGEDVTLRVGLASPADGLAALLAGVTGVRDVRAEEKGATFLFTGELGARHDLLRHLIEHGVPVSSFAEEKLNLQHSYLATVGAREVTR